ncbi:hypothetical protein GGR51DRAFT_526213, partial [Nemania sp. FL0031]
STYFFGKFFLGSAFPPINTIPHHIIIVVPTVCYIKPSMLFFVIFSRCVAIWPMVVGLAGVGGSVGQDAPTVYACH